MPPVTGATPLFAIEAVALDLETTSLDAGKAHIVQVATLPLADGGVDMAAAYDRLVDPAVAIPPRSTEIHGISDAMVRGAPRLPALWPELLARIDGRLVVGHNIGFDLAVLAAEAARHGLDWRKPRALCVRLLATVAAPGLASHSLEALASWLGVEIRDRHRAPGDAEAAARVFLALVPRLQVAGVRTLAEAERACRGLTSELERHVGAGWVPPAAEPADQAFGSVDSYAYRHRVRDVMSGPPVVLAADATLRQAVEAMVARAVSSVFVAADGQPGRDASDYAIVTERDAMRRIAAAGAAALDERIGSIGSRPVVTIRENAFLYRAVGRMTRLGSRHLGVRSDAGALVGAISARDLLKLRAGPALALDDAIEEAGSARDLAVAWSTLPAVVRSLVVEDTDARTVCQVISEEIRSMTRRATVLAEAALAAEGRGGPPCPYAVMVLGSGGRGESLLVPDQDTALVTASAEPGSPEDAWFAELGARMAAILDAGGIPYCKGGVMARNEDWRGSLSTWRSRIERWVRLSRPQDLLNVDIFFDQMPVHGTLPLGATLFEDAFAAGSANPAFAKLLGERLGAVGSPLTLFGGLRGKDGRLDLKQHILFPVASAARVLAIRHGITERSTHARIDGLVARGIGSEAELSALRDAHSLALALLLAQQSADIAAGIKPSTAVDLATLPRGRRGDLKAAVARVQDLPSLLRDLMFA